MDGDIEGVVGVLTRVLGGSDVSLEELNNLSFNSDGEIGTALNEAYVKLREFAIDRDIRANDPEAERKMRARLQQCLEKIDRACDRSPQRAPRDTMASAVRRAG
jgi:hypothetical protein